MQPLWQNKLIQIEILNACNLKCSHCTRFVGHHKVPFFMDIETFKKALDSLEGYPGQIGIMGGEPTLHPRFDTILHILREKIPERRRRELWTNGLNWEKYEKEIKETFDDDLIAYNDHSTPDVKHTPLLVAVKDIIEDEATQKGLIDGCWVQHRWSPCITSNGCYFCEIAAAQDIMFEGKNGWPIEKGWWKKTPEEFQDQVKKMCFNCGATLPIGETSDKATYDLISKSNIEKLKKIGSPKVLQGNYAEYNRKWTRDEVIARIRKSKPFNYRTFKAHTPKDYAFRNLSN